MDKTRELIALAREQAEEVVDLAGDLLRLGAELARVHRKYVDATLDRLAEAEAEALLSSLGDRRAHKALEGLVVTLGRLRNEACEEHERQVEAD